jgi:GH15 family glucan-1,4-alpha-glucosidase
VLDAALQLADQLGDLDGELQEFLGGLADQAAELWDTPDAGMWEARDRERPYVSSKVMCWVALDRAIRLADRLGDAAHVEQWERAREEVRRAVLERAWQPEVGAYTGAFGSDHLDVSVLLMPLVGFLPADDERMLATIHAVRDQLAAGEGFAVRWAGDSHAFLISSFWLVECLALAGEVDEARALFERLLCARNDLGLMAEEYDAEAGELVGNLPQAFSHVGLVNAAWRIDEAARAR